MSKEIVRKCHGCEVTITFAEKAVPIKDEVLWLILQSFKDRMEKQIKAAVEMKNIAKENIYGGNGV